MNKRDERDNRKKGAGGREDEGQKEGNRKEGRKEGDDNKQYGVKIERRGRGRRRYLSL